MSIFSKILGTEKAVESLVDSEKGLLVKTGKWINGLQYTEQEKAENSLLVKEWGLRQLEALAPFKVVQRIIALAVMSLYLIVGLNVLAAVWYDAVNGSNVTENMLQFAFSDYVFWATLVVLGFYMGGGVIPRKSSS